MQKLSICMLLLMLVSAPCRCWARDFVVDQKSATADDAGPGTGARPFKTIKRAVEQVQTGDLVSIKPGVYTEVSLILRASGTAEQPIVFQAERPGTVTIAGGPPLEEFTRSEFPLLFGPPGRDPANGERYKGADYITVRGVMFTDSIGTTIGAGTGWRIEDCLVQRSNFDGISARGDDITILRTVVQNTCLNGLSGGFGSNIVVKDSILRRCNRRGESPGGFVGACKFMSTRGMKVQNLISYDHFGTGWWWDWDSVDYEFTGCTVFGIHAGTAIEGDHTLEQEWAAAGLWSEGNKGPGRIANNTFYGTIGPAIGLLESSNVVVENNLCVDNAAGVEFRDLPRELGVSEEARSRHVFNITVRNNRIKDWRWGAIVTSIGEFKRGPNPIDYKVEFSGNAFDPGINGKPLLIWSGSTADSLDSLKKVPGMANAGAADSIVFRGPKLSIRSTTATELHSKDAGRFVQVQSEDAERISIDDALGAAGAGAIVQIPVFGRTPITQDGGAASCDVYDLNLHRHLHLTFPNDALASAVERAVTPYAILKPVYLRVKLTKRDPFEIQANAVGIGP